MPVEREPRLYFFGGLGKYPSFITSAGEKATSLAVLVFCSFVIFEPLKRKTCIMTGFQNSPQQE